MNASREPPLTVISTPRHEQLKRLPFVPAIKVRAASTLVFVSGIMGTPDDMLISQAPTPPGDIGIEAERIFARLRFILERAGSRLDHIVKITKYMTDLNQHDAVVAVMRKHLGDHLPASTTVEVSRLVLPGFGLEIDAVAVVADESA